MADIGVPEHGERPVASAPAKTTSGWAIGWTYFAAMMMILIGTFHAIAGLIAIFEDEFYVARPASTCSSSMRRNGAGSTSSGASSSRSPGDTCSPGRCWPAPSGS